MIERQGTPDPVRQEQDISPGGFPREKRLRKPGKPRVRFPKGLIKAFSRMPELRHNPRPDLPFDICRSEVVKWLLETALEQPEFLRAFFDAAYHSGLIGYDRERKMWKGCAYGAERRPE